MITRLSNFWTTIHRRGVRYIWYLFAGYLIPAFLYRIIYMTSRRLLKILGFTFGCITALLLLTLLSVSLGWLAAGCFFAGGMIIWFGGSKFYSWWTIQHLGNQAGELMDVAQLSNTVLAFTEWDELPLPVQTRNAIHAALQSHPVADEMVIGQFDDDGKVFGLFGPLPGIGLGILLDKSEFRERKRYSVDLVILGGKLLVRKDFAGDGTGFMKEWYCLARLQNVINVSAIYRVDKNRKVLFKNFILGRKMRDILIDAGVEIKDLDLATMENLGLTAAARADEIARRVLEVLPSRFSAEFFRDLERQFNLAHSLGITNFGFTINNVIVDQNDRPCFFDFDGAVVFNSPHGLLFSYRRDQDRERFNRHYGERLLTERSVRRVIKENAGKETLSETQTQGWYAPIDFGGGLVVGGLGSTETGFGRWEYFNKKIVTPIVFGKRVLDLGSNNGLMTLLMLRCGAKEAVGVELSPELVERSRLVQRIFEWRDMRNYNLTFYQDDMRAVLTNNWGIFDVITAYCSLYFVSSSDMESIVRKASELASTIIVQANLRVPDTGDGRTKRASLHFLKDLLEMNGFPQVEIHAPQGYPRPLLIGRR